MNKTININLGGFSFHIDEDAYQKLDRYLKAIEKSLQDDTEGKKEIMADIEFRISELLTERIKNNRQVVNLEDINQVISIMGQPEDYTDFEENYSNSTNQTKIKKLFRDSEDKFLGGVASGIAHYFSVDVIWIRLALLLLFISSVGTVGIIYFILWILVPVAKTTAEKLQMKGEPVNISSIEKKIREEFTNLSKKMKR